MQINTRNIKAIVFDLGNVLIPIDWPRSKKCFENISNTTISPEIETQLEEIATASEKGLITENEFRERFCAALKASIDKETFDKCWNSIIIDYPQQSRLLTYLLAEKYDIYILSNLNSIHYRYIKTLPLWDEKPFKKLFLSFRMLSVKPEKEIFEKLIKEINVKPEEIIYFDDRTDHIATARSMGINAVIVKDRNTLATVAQYFPFVKEKINT